MSDFQAIEQKLSEFKKKFYLSALLRGGIFFVALGVVYFLLTAWIEELLWLSSAMRALVFWFFVAGELALWFYWIWPALSVLIGIKQPMSHQEAAQIIGTQIPEVGDRLTNTLDLLNQKQETELVLASIAQKSKILFPFYFGGAIDFKDNLRHLRWLVLPSLLLLLIWLFGDLSSLFAGYQRVAAYNQEFVRPAPYELTLLNQELRARNNQEIRLSVAATGDILPAEVFVVIDGQKQTMIPKGNQRFESTLPPQNKSFEFYFGTELFRSENYAFEVVYGPEINEFVVTVSPPAYTGMSQETIQNTGNIRVLTGSKVTWFMKAGYTDQIMWHNNEDSLYFDRQANQSFSLSRTVFKSEKYFLSPRNTQVGFDPGVAFAIETYPDERPKMVVETQEDSLNSATHHKILAWDDFLITKVDVVCYPADDPKDQRKLGLPFAKESNVQSFYTFPSGFELVKGKAYQYFFEAWDNDAVSGPKSVRSDVFGHKQATLLETQDKLLSQQSEQTNQIEQALKSLAEQNKQAQQFEQSQRQKESLNWQDERNLERLLEKQQQNLKELEQQTESLKDILERFKENQSSQSQESEQLMERIEEQLESLKEQSDKWEELRELQEQLQEEDLLEEMAQQKQQQKAQEQNLERLVEMTRRFFVTQKMNQISEQLKDLGQRQEQLAQEQENQESKNQESESATSPEQKEEQQAQKKERQEQLNQEFDDIKEALEKLEQENNKLKQPMDLPRDPGGEMDVSEQQQKATKALEQSKNTEAQKAQKQAGQKMQEMAQKMGSQMQQMQQQAMQEDTQMLRQILDNLLVFSLAQEGHMNLVEKRQLGGWSAPDYINRQNDLRDNFSHIDDSLYALSMRQPMISSQVNQSLSQASYYLNRTLEDLAETRFSSAASAQQFVFTQANDLANVLDGVATQMEQMSMSMPGAGSGQGAGSQGFQLQDIIQQQQSLQSQSDSKGQQGEQSGEGSSDSGQSGQQGQQGQSNQGESGQNQGDQNQGEKSGKQGSSGKNGNKSGSNKNGNSSEQGQSDSYSDSEAERAARYSIYREQQQLRQELEDRLRKQGLLDSNRDVLQKMEQNAQEILRNGINNRSKALMKEINYQLIKLEQAQYQQEKEQNRESQANTRTYDPAQNNPWREERRYFDQLDILIKDALPLQPYYKSQVDRYFKMRNKANDQF